MEHDRVRVDLFAARTSRVPDPEQRIRAQVRHHAISKREMKLRVAKKSTDPHRQVVEDAPKQSRVGENLVLELAQVRQAGLRERREDAALERGFRVVAQIVPVLTVDRLEEQADLDRLRVFIRLHRSWRTRAQLGACR